MSDGSRGAQAPLVIAEQGSFWLGVDRRETASGVFAAGQCHVQYQIPAEPTLPYPIVLVHGGGGQGLDYLSTPDGRPGWATFFLRRGYKVYVLDRPLHGRSPARPEDGGPPPYAVMSEMFTAPAKAARYPRARLHTQWPGSGECGDPALDQLAAGMSAMPDFATAEADMRRCGAALLDRIGPCVLVVHSAGAPFAWHAADARPGGVKAVIAIEAIGPPFSSHRFGALSWGLTATPLTFDPPVADPAVLARSDAPSPALLHLADVPILVVTAEASWVAEYDHETFDFLVRCGAPAKHLRLESVGIRGNGHMMMAERNSDEIAAALAEWLADKGL